MTQTRLQLCKSVSPSSHLILTHKCFSASVLLMSVWLLEVIGRSSPNQYKPNSDWHSGSKKQEWIRFPTDLKLAQLLIIKEAEVRSVVFHFQAAASYRILIFFTEIVPVIGSAGLASWGLKSSLKYIQQQANTVRQSGRLVHPSLNRKPCFPQYLKTLTKLSVLCFELPWKSINLLIFSFLVFKNCI